MRKSEGLSLVMEQKQRIIIGDGAKAEDYHW